MKALIPVAYAFGAGIATGIGIITVLCGIYILGAWLCPPSDLDGQR
jgi:hypothetical protein